MKICHIGKNDVNDGNDKTTTWLPLVTISNKHPKKYFTMLSLNFSESPNALLRYVYYVSSIPILFAAINLY